MRNLLLVLGLGLVLTSCEKEPLDDWAAGYSGETNTTEEEEEEEEVSDVTLLSDVQLRLDTGELPIDIYMSGVPLSTIYNKNIYKGGYICYLDTVNGGGLVAHKGRLSNVSFNIAIQYAEELVVMSRDSMFYYNDWRIPTRWELLHLAKQRRVMNSAYSNSNFYFFSSTKYNYYGGYKVVSISFMNTDIKEELSSSVFYYAKAVRSFNNYIEL